MHQVDLIRGRTLQLLKNLSIYISCLPTREQTALERLTGAEGQKTFSRITEYVLEQLGHTQSIASQSFKTSYRQAANYVPEPTPTEDPEPLKKKGWPKGKKRVHKEPAQAVSPI